MSTIEHLIYDFDGTIANSYPLFFGFLKTIAQNRGIRIPCDDTTLYRALKTTGMDAYRAMDCADIIDYSAFMEDFHALQEEHRASFPIFSNVEALLRDAIKAGKKNYLYTHTGPVVKDMLARMGILDCFTFVLDSSYKFPLKPAPDALQYLTKRFSLDPKTCIMIGDRPIDAHAGMNAGMYGCLWDDEDLFGGARVDYYVKDLDEVRSIVGF